tara:strand:- start:6319 stop:7047 length:729 start_codon:yes stop_codon:yes gene_type:complete
MNLINLEQAKELVALLEKGDKQKANENFVNLAEPLKTELFAEIGKLTRQLHDSMNKFSDDTNIQSLKDVDFDDAQEGLSYVIRITEEAANKTMDLAEKVHPLAVDLQIKLDQFVPIWKKLLAREIDVSQFQKLCREINLYFDQVQKTAVEITSLTNDIVLAQGFQDLSGQVIKRTIDMIEEVQNNLIDILKIFGDVTSTPVQEEKKIIPGTKAEGPIVNAEKRDDVAQNQDEVDDLLSSLGF